MRDTLLLRAPVCLRQHQGELRTRGPPWQSEARGENPRLGGMDLLRHQHGHVRGGVLLRARILLQRHRQQQVSGAGFWPGPTCWGNEAAAGNDGVLGGLQWVWNGAVRPSLLLRHQLHVHRHSGRLQAQGWDQRLSRLVLVRWRGHVQVWPFLLLRSWVRVQLHAGEVHGEGRPEGRGGIGQEERSGPHPRIGQLVPVRQAPHVGLRRLLLLRRRLRLQQCHRALWAEGRDPRRQACGGGEHHLGQCLYGSDPEVERLVFVLRVEHVHLRLLLLLCSEVHLQPHVAAV
mmetsp:Transcript_66153/g.184202  ORF Transcript_66153/g.184202 Transcript_66153/m.184202 type:complete len:288 (+) Transcript_66153:190-1053(+)